ncbi:hypothetical protein GCM10025875_12130 [Litorihabitans aurantiacus]|uniref:Uncharacterized protein n=1 Tax=Litorihabitans aurantiacus TaxID=1930061 RepID=A0AA37UVE9_9MICO|nr:hypothetical protein GCM10025875_12130 [Litorihabitans aurantiacus]
MPRQGGRDAVAQVGRQARPGPDRLAHLRPARVGVPDGDPHTPATILATCAAASGVCGDSVTIPTGPASCQRATSPESTGRMCAVSWTPRAPSWSERKGPSTCANGTAAATCGDSRRARATARRAATIRSSGAVMIVGTQEVTPIRARVAVISCTAVSGSSPLTSCPP